MTGELEEIKNDISSFRCEVLETMKGMTKEIMLGNGYISSSAQAIPKISHRRPPNTDQSMEIWMASVETRFAELTDSFAGIMALGKDALTKKRVLSVEDEELTGEDRAHVAEMCKSQ